MKLKFFGVLVCLCPMIALAQPRIAVVDFDTNQYSAQLAGAQLADYVVDELVNTSMFEVVEREKLSTVSRELGFGSSGMVDMSSANQIGRLAGASLLMTGRVISLGQEEKTFTGYGISSRNTILSLTVSVRIVDTESGSVVFSTRKTTQKTVNESGGLSIRSSSGVNALSEQAAQEVVAEIVRSGRFSVAGSNPSETPPLSKVEVRVTSTPINADVEVDGVFYGNAGGVLQLPQGLHVVRISLAGYQPWEKRVMVNSGASINATLAPLPEQ